MDEKFQDRIDDYLLGRMTDADREVFMSEVEQDGGKKSQLEFTQNVKDSVCSREEKLKALNLFRQQYEEERRAAAMRVTGTEGATDYSPAPVVGAKPVWPKKRMWLWISGVAAVLVIGFFAIKPMFVYEPSPIHNGKSMEQMRGGDDIFAPVPNDSACTDTIGPDFETMSDE